MTRNFRLGLMYSGFSAMVVIALTEPKQTAIPETVADAVVVDVVPNETVLIDPSEINEIIEPAKPHAESCDDITTKVVASVDSYNNIFTKERTKRISQKLCTLYKKKIAE